MTIEQAVQELEAWAKNNFDDFDIEVVNNEIIFSISEDGSATLPNIPGLALVSFDVACEVGGLRAGYRAYDSYEYPTLELRFEIKTNSLLAKVEPLSTRLRVKPIGY